MKPMFADVYPANILETLGNAVATTPFTAFDNDGVARVEYTITVDKDPDSADGIGDGEALDAEDPLVKVQTPVQTMKY